MLRIGPRLGKTNQKVSRGSGQMVEETGNMGTQMKARMRPVHSGIWNVAGGPRGEMEMLWGRGDGLPFLSLDEQRQEGRRR